VNEDIQRRVREFVEKLDPKILEYLEPHSEEELQDALRLLYGDPNAPKPKGVIYAKGK
jgi:hypothetical protein